MRGERGGKECVGKGGQERGGQEGQEGRESAAWPKWQGYTGMRSRGREAHELVRARVNGWGEQS